MVEGFIYLHELETSCNCLKWGRKGLRKSDGGGDLINVKSKAIQNCHSEFHPYNEYILIKIWLKNAYTSCTYLNSHFQLGIFLFYIMLHPRI
jgi:hypothetical protein